MRSPDTGDPPDALAPALAALEAHWHGLRGPRLMPARGEIRARDIDPALPCLFLAEPVAPSVLRIRHAGRSFAGVAGMEPRGMPLCAFFTPEGRAALRPLLAEMQERPAILGLDLIAGRGIVAPRVAARLLILPLSDTGLRPDCFVGVLACPAAVQRPLRFDIGAGPVRLDPLQAGAARPRLVASGGLRRAGHAPRPALRLVVANG
ncbi:MAG: PAS domain-containing protein [Rubellimicrobium sp.]|nr:PAS domain-containing protein [Rubellimicrobium sp.]